MSTHTTVPETLLNDDSHKVLRNTYFLLSLTLMVSAGAAAVAMMSGLGHLGAMGFMLLGFVLLFVIQKTARTAQGLGWVFAFTACLGASVGPMLSNYFSLENGAAMVLQALGGTAFIFFALSAYVLTSRKNFSFLGGFLMIGFLVAVIAMLASIFLQLPALNLAISALIILLMSGFILYDTSNIIHGGETNYVLATVSMYLNVFNIFTSLLQLIGLLDD
jgi:modulator of FtsH protease